MRYQPNLDNNLLQSFSQHGQDLFVYNLFFKDKNNGIFVDIGAFDGKDLSNTFMFEKYLNWTGYCFEPLPEVFIKCKQNRPKSECFELAVGEETKKVEFCIIEGYPTMLSGVLDNYDNRHKERIDNELASHGGNKKVLEVSMVQLSDILKNDQHIDFLSIDIEGGEAKVLANILKSFRPLVITAEANYEIDCQNLDEVTLNQGYHFVTQLGCDRVYSIL